jgi:hypothetical protein
VTEDEIYAAEYFRDKAKRRAVILALCTAVSIVEAVRPGPISPIFAAIAIFASFELVAAARAYQRWK